MAGRVEEPATDLLNVIHCWYLAHMHLRSFSVALIAMSKGIHSVDQSGAHVHQIVFHSEGGRR